MTKRIVIINGSLRSNGNTDTIIDSFIGGTYKKAVVKQFTQRDMNIQGCKGCMYCFKNESCSIKDDMTEIHNEIQKADLILLASPSYWWGVTGIAKTFIDR